MLSHEHHKRYEALWELFYAEVVYLVDNLVVLRDVSLILPLEYIQSKIIREVNFSVIIFYTTLVTWHFLTDITFIKQILIKKKKKVFRIPRIIT